MKLQLDDWQKDVLNAKGNKLLVSGRQVGKSMVVAMDCGEYAVKNPNKSILIISATERQAEELFAKVLNYLGENYLSYVMKGKHRPTKKVLKLRNGTIIRSLPTGLAGVGIRGYTIHRLYADEAAYIPDAVWTAVTPMLLTTGGDIILVSTPQGKQGYFYQSYIDGSFKIFHVKSEEVIMNRKISPSWSKFQKQAALDYLEREKKKMSKLQYAQEYMGNFIDEFKQFFSDKLIRSCMKMERRDYLKKRATYFLGVDVARMGEDECTFEIIERSDKNKLIHVESIIFKKVYLNQVTEKVIELHGQYNFKKVYIDDGGIGVGVFDYLLHTPGLKNKVEAINNRARPLDKDDRTKKKLLKEDLYNNLLVLMERGDILLLNDDNVALSLKSIQYEYLQHEGQPTRLRIFGNYSHIVEGLIRACWCTRDKALNIWVR